MDARPPAEPGLVLGLDLGGSGFRVARVVAGRDGLAVAGSLLERGWPAHAFEPVPLDEQLLERAAGGMRLSDAESREARDRVGLLARAVEEAAGRELEHPLRLAIAAPGLPVKDGRGLAVVRHGPRVPDLCERLEARLADLGARVERIPRIAGDGLAGAWGELAAGAGRLRGLRDALYLAGGSGLAEALVVDGEPRGLDAVPGASKAWEARSAEGASFEDLIAPGRWNAAHGRKSPESRVARGDERARELCERAARALAELVLVRAQDLRRCVGEAAAFERVAVGGALARVLARPANAWLRERFEAELAARFPGGAPELALSELRSAPAIGAVAIALGRRAR